MSDDPQGFNLGLVFETLAATLPDRDCLVWGDRRWTYAELAERSRRLASFLHGRGYGVHTPRAELEGHRSGQDHVALALYNGNEYLESMVGSYLARLAPFNVNYRYVGDELRYLFNDAAPKVLIYHASLAPTIAAVLDAVESIELLIQVADDSGHALLEGAIDYEAALAAGDPAGPAEVTPSPDDLYILYTGGTTGMPKGVLWRQHDIYLSAMGGRMIGTWEPVASYAEVADRARNGFGLRAMILPPLMHGAAQWSTFLMLANGSTLVLPQNPRHLDPADVLRTIEREQVNLFTVVGDAMLRPLLIELEHASYDTSTLLSIGNGGAPLTAAIRARVAEQLPNVLITDSVGSSETGAQMHASSASGEPAGQFRPGPGAVVLSEDLTEVLGVGHEGIGWLGQVGWVPLGYLGDADKTARTFPTIDGRRYSIPGDRAILLDDGEIELLGRDSVTISSGGEKIFAEEVEAALAGHPALTDVVVAGRPSEQWGQEVVAVVSLRPGASITLEELQEFASAHVARYKLPKDVVIVETVVRSPSGKADYRWARDQAIAART